MKKKHIKEQSNFQWFLDICDKYDRMFYGHRLKLIVIFSFILIIAQPFEKYLTKLLGFNISELILTLFTIFSIIILFSWIGSWRDNKGNWTIKRTFNKIKTYTELFIFHIRNISNLKNEERIRFYTFFLLGTGIILSGYSSLVTFVNVLIRYFTDSKLPLLIKLSIYSKQIGTISLFLSLLVLLYGIKKYSLNLYLGIYKKKKNNDIENWKEFALSDDYVINLKDDVKTDLILNKSKSKIFFETVRLLRKWNPNQSDYEYEYQDKLFFYLSKNLPEAEIELEKPIGFLNDIYTRGRADLVINNTILIELKKKIASSELQRAKGQIEQYLNIWKTNGPVILLICHSDFKLVKSSLDQFLKDQNKLGKFTIAFLV